MGGGSVLACVLMTIEWFLKTKHKLFFPKAYNTTQHDNARGGQLRGDILRTTTLCLDYYVYSKALRSLLRSQRLSSVLKWINILKTVYLKTLCDYVSLNVGTVSDLYKFINKNSTVLERCYAASTPF